MKTKLGPRITNPNGSYFNIHTGTNHPNRKYYESGIWLIQRRDDGRWLGYCNCLFVEDFAHDESAALEWLKSKITNP